MSKNTIIIFTLMILGAVLRFYGNTANPVSLNVDEVSTGYNAYSILKTGKDEYGYQLPLTFKSLGDYKPPLYIYLTSLSIALFGLNEFSVRFLSALIGVLSIPLLYLFLKELTGEKSYALVGAILLTISPWHLYFSRMASESQVATFFVILGVWCLLRMLKGGYFWSAGAAVSLALSMYAYHSERLFVPFIVLVLLIFKKRELLKQKNRVAIFIVIMSILLIPLTWSILFGSDRTRAQMTFIANDINFLRYIAVEPRPSNSLLLDSVFGNSSLLMIFYGVRKFLAYFQPSFLFYNGLGMTTPGSYGLGVLYLFEIPLLIMGIITLLKKQIANRWLIFWWIILGIVPAALTLNEQHPIRTMVILPMTILISAIGGVELWNLYQLRFKGFVKKGILISCILFVFWNLVQALLMFTVHFPRQKGEGLMEGTKQAVEYILAHKDQYNEIVFDPVRGVEGPFIVSVPHVYILFYSQYDPAIFQQMLKREKNNTFGFDKYTIRPIDWRLDRDQRGKLFIGSPWSMPLQDVKENEILQRIYLSNGKLAMLIVSPEGTGVKK